MHCNGMSIGVYFNSKRSDNWDKGRPCDRELRNKKMDK